MEKFGRSFQTNEVVFREGDHADTMYIIQAGQVKITKRAGKIEKTLSIISAPDFFGEMGIINSKPRSATAIVLVPSSMLVLQERTLNALIQSNTAIALRFITKLCDRLRVADRQIEELLIQDKKSKIVSHLLNYSHKFGNYSPNGVQLIAKEVADHITETVGAKMSEVSDILHRLDKTNIIRFQDPFLYILNQDELEKFKNFLEMREKLAE